MSIHILPLDVINQISAGEVVERPAHLVKELVENSLDAGSTEIHIEILCGGRGIKISDNGSGIDKNDLVLALTRHATSKIQQTNDLWNLSTFGFRGEALASAAAVSKLNISSINLTSLNLTSLNLSSQKNKNAWQIRSDFGIFSEILPSSRNQGTEIIIEDLFENVPARLKFLKSDASENAQIRNVIKAMALSNYNVEFKMVESGQLDLYYPKRENQIDRVREVLNCQKLFTYSANRENYKSTAYFSSPQDVAKTSKNIWIFAQGRWVQDRGLQAAVMEAYRNLLMHGEYPNVFIYLECHPADIDVNIHPTKSQVKFQSPSLAFRAVQASVRDGLETAPWVPKNSNIESAVQKYSTLNYEIPEAKNYTFNDQSFVKTQFQNKDFSFQHKTPVENTPVNISSNQQTYWSSFQIIGQMNLTYIVCQKNDQMILVDQHAAHERVAFEKLMRKWQGGIIDLQNYLFPLAIDMSPEKCEAVLYHKSDIQKMGIEIEQMGPSTLGIKSAPLFVKESSLPRVFEKLATDTIEFGGSFNLEKSISDVFATMACHSVIRAGQSISQAQMQELLISMDEFPLSSFCPHGRPVSVEMTFTEIEKMFGRIN